MSRVVVIGGVGHVGAYLVPRLVEAGHDVVIVSRGLQKPYLPHAAWSDVQQVSIDRIAAEKDGSFGRLISDLEPEVVIDMICFTEESARHLVTALAGRVQHFLHCGTIWVHGPSVEVPTTELQPRRPFGEYGIRKAQIEAYLLAEARRNGFPATILHPGHICGKGWMPLNPAGNFNPEVYTRLATGQEVLLPNFGLETVHHVHADDVAQAFMQAIANWRTSVGESFHVVSPAAVTLHGFAETAAAWFDQEANLRYLPWDEWRTLHSEEDATATSDHIRHSPNCSIEKARRLIGYNPRYTSFQTVYEAVMWLIEHGQLPIHAAGSNQ